MTFANKEDAERALAESGLEIAGAPRLLHRQPCRLLRTAPHAVQQLCHCNRCCGLVRPAQTHCQPTALFTTLAFPLVPPPGVAIKNLTMVEDRDKYYTNKHASARQALLQVDAGAGCQAAGS